MGLTAKQKIFVHEYLVGFNATQAAIRAGYNEKAARQIGDENMSKPAIQVYIQERMDERMKRLNIDADYVLQRLVEIDQMDILDIMTGQGVIKPVDEWPKVWRQSLVSMDVTELFEGKGDQKTLVGLLKKIKWPDKLKNLELIGKHQKVGAFSERRDHKHSFIGADGQLPKFKINVSYVSPEGVRNSAE